MTCKHERLQFAIHQNIMTDRPGRMLEFRGKCADCGAEVRFHGMPIGTSFNRPTMSLGGDELRLPITVGDETHLPGPEAIGDFSFIAKEPAA